MKTTKGKDATLRRAMGMIAAGMLGLMLLAALVASQAIGCEPVDDAAADAAGVGWMPFLIGCPACVAFLVAAGLLSLRRRRRRKPIERRLRPLPTSEARHEGDTWTDVEVYHLIVRSAEGMSFRELSHNLKRTEGACRAMLRELVAGRRPDLEARAEVKVEITALRMRQGISLDAVTAAKRDYWRAHLDRIPDRVLNLLLDRLDGDLTA